MQDFEKEVLTALGDLKAQQARMEERLNSMYRKLDDMRMSSKEHDGRLDALEKWRVKVSAWAAGAGAMAGLAGNWIAKKLGLH